MVYSIQVESLTGEDAREISGSPVPQSYRKLEVRVEGRS